MPNTPGGWHWPGFLSPAALWPVAPPVSKQLSQEIFPGVSPGVFSLHQGVREDESGAVGRGILCGSSHSEGVPSLTQGQGVCPASEPLSLADAD